MEIHSDPVDLKSAAAKLRGLRGDPNETGGKKPFASWVWSTKPPPPRHWEYGRHYIRGSLACTIADGGVGKTSLDITEAIVMATGRDLLGVKPKRQFRVLYWNGEEPHEEIRRRVFAICQRYRIDPAELDGWLFTSSGLGHRINASDDNGLVDLKICIEDHQIEIVILDPFVACHRAPENDNTALDIVAKRLAALADSKKVSIEVAHHTRKPAHGEADIYTVHDSRGAVALINAARTVRIINRMTQSEASIAGIQNRRAYVRIDDGKANYAALGEAQWLQIGEETLDNFDGIYGPDSVGVITPWRFPGAFDGVGLVHLDEVVERAASGRYRADPQSPVWIGVAVADVLQLDPVRDAKRIKAILKQWFANGALKKETRKDEQSHNRSFVVPGTATS
jgi:hypothetical protein